MDVNFLMIDAEFPTLLSLRDMVINKLDLSIVGQCHKFEGRDEPLQMSNYCLINVWIPRDTHYILYTDADHRLIHRNFGHRKVRTPINFLKQESTQPLPPQVRGSIEAISQDCTVCKRPQTAARLFKLTLGAEYLRFNHNIQVYTMFIHSKQVLHIVDYSTHYTAATFLRSQTTQLHLDHHTEPVFHDLLRTPDYLTVDQ